MDRKTVLVIDDEEHVRMLYAEELGALGYKTVLSDGGSDPLALVEEHKPDLIILDIKLESRSGLDMLQIIRFSAPWPVIWPIWEPGTADEALRNGSCTASACWPPWP